jgi:hypothetical protein
VKITKYAKGRPNEGVTGHPLDHHAPTQIVGNSTSHPLTTMGQKQNYKLVVVVVVVAAAAPPPPPPIHNSQCNKRSDT